MVGDGTGYSAGISSDLRCGVPIVPPVALVLSHRHHGIQCLYLGFLLYYYCASCLI